MYLNKRLYLAVTVVIFVFIASFESVLLFTVAQFLLLGLVLLVLLDFFLLFGRGNRVVASRACAGRFSNGDDNEVKIRVESSYPIALRLEIRDETPDIFQFRDLRFQLGLQANENKVVVYHLHPVVRGEYIFGNVNVFASSRIGLVSRRFRTGQGQAVKVYPSFLRLRKYELMAISNKLTDTGMKHIRKMGQQLELEHIKEYVKGDDYRTINWKATARRNDLMVNVFQDERSQSVYNLIDKGRTMQSASEGMTLLDYSINAALALSYISTIKGDKTGLVTFERTYDTVIPASRHGKQMNVILDALYKERTSFAESDFSSLYACVKQKITQRSLLLVYTNFDTEKAMQRQLTYLRLLAKQHTVVVIFFENTELLELKGKAPANKVETYEKVIAEKLISEKQRIIKKLRQNNIISILTQPQDLTVNVINKYLELKARNVF